MGPKFYKDALKRVDYWFSGTDHVGHPDLVRKLFVDLGLGQWTVNDLLMGVRRGWVEARLMNLAHEAKVKKRANARQRKLERRRKNHGG